jgi:hypothetical protein
MAVFINRQYKYISCIIILLFVVVGCESPMKAYGRMLTKLHPNLLYNLYMPAIDLPDSQIAILLYNKSPIDIEKIDDKRVARDYIKKENNLYRIDLLPGKHSALISYYKNISGGYITSISNNQRGIQVEFDAKPGCRYRVEYVTGGDRWSADIIEIKP